jgi:threonylcarbamoyladenosine tRNA methylthiotransferase MtaB
MTNEIKTITLGCRLNSYESDIIKSYKNDSINKNIVVINTCAVTAEAERQGRQQVRKARKKYPEAYIMATGCAVELDKNAWNNMPEVDKIIPNKNKLSPSLWGLKPEINNKRAIKEDASHLQSIRGHTEKTRAFIRIQNGCNHSCTFCIITVARGDSVSVPSGSIISEIKKTVSAGIQEIILTGVDLTSYGEDLPGQNNLGKLVKKILKLVPELQRLRISSLDAAEIDNDLMEAFKTEKRLMPHLHLSLQSHDNIILKRMKRRHSTKDAENLINRLKEIRPNILFGADLIAGFPTENELAFRNTLNSIEKLNLTFLHVFPYSSRPETPAARMPQIPLKEIKKRAKSLRESGDIQLKKELKKSINTFHNVLVETATGVGHSENFLTVKVKKATERKIYKCKITGIENDMLIGDIHESI